MYLPENRDTFQMSRQKPISWFGKVFAVYPSAKSTINDEMAKSCKMLGKTGTYRHRTYSGMSCSPLKYLSCGLPCSMVCTTNWSSLTEVSLWDCYIIAGKWQRPSLFNCDTLNPNVLNCPCYRANHYYFLIHLVNFTDLSEDFTPGGKLCCYLDHQQIKLSTYCCLLISVCAELILDFQTLPYGVCSLISRMSALSLRFWGSLTQHCTHGNPLEPAAHIDLQPRTAEI